MTINLKDLSPEDRTLITIGCEPFYIGFNENKKLIPVHNHFMKYLPSNHKKEVWVFITSAINPIKKGLSGSMFSLRKANYTKANELNGSKISYVKCKRVVETLDKLGYINLYKGFFDLETNTSLKSCYTITDRLIEVFDKVDMERVGRPLPVATFIELRDSKTGDLITELSKLRGIKNKRELVVKYNKVLEAFDIRCKMHPVCAVYKRVFTDCLDKHGRWYTQSCLQTTRSEFRKHITINGMKTTEVDFKQMHPRILMEIDKVYKPMSWEPYCCIKDILGEGDDTNSSRLLSKYAMMCLLNSKDIKTAKAALFKIFSEKSEFKGIRLGKGDITKIFDRLIEKNENIAHWFGKEDLWAMLQHYDSEIAAYVINVFTNLSKCVLPWHDSFVVSVNDRDLLIQTMRDGWKEVLGDNRNCFYDIEF